MYQRSLEVGILPSEFWGMSLKEINDTVSLRIKAKNNEIYALSGMLRLAVLSVFSKDVQFPSPPDNDENEEGWKKSKAYFKILQERRRNKH